MSDINELYSDMEFLDKLIIGIGEVSQITGIAIRQIRYWEEKGIITSLNDDRGKSRRFDYPNIKKMLLVKELMEDGYTLDSAAEKVRRRVSMIQEALDKLKNKE